VNWIRTVRPKADHHHIWGVLVPTLASAVVCPGSSSPSGQPNARKRALLGDFNNWEWRTHPMQQRLGGIWELFHSRLALGPSLQYEWCVSPEGHCYRKPTPMVFRHEIRPQTGSVGVPSWAKFSLERSPGLG